MTNIKSESGKKTSKTKSTGKKAAAKKTTSAATKKSTAKTSKQKTAAKSKAVSVEDIRKRAHEIYQERGGHGGTADEDWLKAERELRGEI